MMIIPIPVHTGRGGGGGFHPRATGKQLESIPEGALYAEVYRKPDEWLEPWCAYIYKQGEYMFIGSAYAWTQAGVEKKARRIMARLVASGMGVQVIV